MRGSSNSKKPTDPRRKRAERHGHWAEAMAIAALSLKGYRLLARRFKTPHGEIDLIMRRGRATVFIEVKQRADLDSALLSVSPSADEADFSGFALLARPRSSRDHRRLPL